MKNDLSMLTDQMLSEEYKDSGHSITEEEMQEFYEWVLNDLADWLLENLKSFINLKFSESESNLSS